MTIAEIVSNGPFRLDSTVGCKALSWFYIPDVENDLGQLQEDNTTQPLPTG